MPKSTMDDHHIERRSLNNNRVYQVITKRLLFFYCLLFLGSASMAQEIVLVPATDSPPDGLSAVADYAQDERWGIQAVLHDGMGDRAIERVQLQMPSPFKDGFRLSDSRLPNLPQGSIYRFKLMDIESVDGLEVPFEYIEVDWNTEGAPRGPNGSFVNPHFDFHFYTKSQSYVNREMICVTLQKTCDAQQTGYAQMRRFLRLPEASFLPSEYFPDSGSSIAKMGLHNLDGSFEYTIENVNHNPVIIYGTFDGEVVFLEGSLTLFAFQDAIKAAQGGGKSTWAIPQPASHAYAWWPKTMELEYHPEREVFSLSLADFQQHQVKMSD